VSQAVVAAQAGRRKPSSSRARRPWARQWASKLPQALPIIAATANASRRLQSTAHGAPAASHVKFGIPLLSANDARRCCRRLVVSCLALPCRRRMREAAGGPQVRVRARLAGHGRGKTTRARLAGCIHESPPATDHSPLITRRLRAGRRVSPTRPGRRLSPHGCSNVDADPASVQV